MTPRFATPADDQVLSSILADPSVRAGVACDDERPFDPSAYTAHPKSRAILVDEEGVLGCWLLPALEQDAYGVHTCLLPICRGARAIQAAKVALQFVFVQTDAMQLWTMVPENNPGALWFAHTMGFRDQYTRSDVWKCAGKAWAMTYLRLDVDHWVQGSQWMRDAGELFHVKRGEHLTHAHDAMHDRYVGYAVTAVRAGQLAKARHVYNRWARACGYHPFEYVSTEPLRVDIGDAVVRLDGDEITFEEAAHA